MSIIDSNARFEDEDKAMQAYLDQQDAEMAEVYDNEVYPTPAEERVMEADHRVECAERYLDYLDEQDPEEWTEANRDMVGHGFWGELGRAYRESIEAKKALRAAQMAWAQEGERDA